MREQQYDDGSGCLEGRVIEVPAKAPTDGKELVFWHEFGHWLLNRVLTYPRLIGYQGMLQQGEETYWVHERLCEAFADIMLLHRRGLAEFSSPETLEAFLFEDTVAVGYAQVIRGSLRRIRQQCERARAALRNIPLSDTEELLQWLERSVHNAAFQPLLPTTFPDCHQTPWVSYIDEREDALAEERHWGKDSWKMTPPIERWLFLKIRTLQNIGGQFALFEETAEDDRRKVVEGYQRLEKAVKRFKHE